MRVLMLCGLLGAVLLTACTARVTPPAVEIEVDGPIDVEVRDGGGFCPPGQRKQGKC
jgi:hypothetical protein